LEISEKFCPVCKNKNKRKAVVCQYCGALLDETRTDQAATTRNTSGLTKVPAKIPESLIDYALIPKDGIAIYAAGASKPVYIRIDKELVIGRKEAETSETFLDLSGLGLDGFNMGLSRRHALIRRIPSGYEIIDLSSTNGTWQNDRRLVPNKPYQMPSGAQLRFSLLQVLVVYHSDFNPKK
jgi:hypothetical protein